MVTRRGFIILTQFCADYIFSEFSDINTIYDIDSTLHTNFEPVGDCYISYSDLYEGVNLQAKK